MTNPVVSLVAPPGGGGVPPPFPGAGSWTIRGDPDGIGWLVPSYVVALPDPLSETQIPLLSPNAIPHGFTRFGSVILAIPGMSETRLVCVKVGGRAATAERRR